MTDFHSSTGTAELLPCPFCGKTYPAIGCVTGFRHYAGERQAVSRIECTCGAHGPIASGTLTLQADALRAWNTRAPAQQQPDPTLTPKNFLDDILSACDPSNWDADRNTGDYYKGLRDAYEGIQEIATEYQASIYAWTLALPSTDLSTPSEGK